jgi:predicted acylesterase/phospholipase RssA
VWDVFSRSLDITSRAVTQYRLDADHPEIIVRPQVYEIDTLDVVDVHEVAKKGEEAVEAVLPQLKTLFTWRTRWRRTIGVNNHRSIYNERFT